MFYSAQYLGPDMHSNLRSHHFIFFFIFFLLSLVTYYGQLRYLLRGNVLSNKRP